MFGTLVTKQYIQDNKANYHADRKETRICIRKFDKYTIYKGYDFSFKDNTCYIAEFKDDTCYIAEYDGTYAHGKTLFET